MARWRVEEVQEDEYDVYEGSRRVLTNVDSIQAIDFIPVDTVDFVAHDGYRIDGVSTVYALTIGFD